MRFVSYTDISPVWFVYRLGVIIYIIYIFCFSVSTADIRKRPKSTKCCSEKKGGGEEEEYEE